jgi:hypothetical protein
MQSLRRCGDLSLSLAPSVLAGYRGGAVMLFGPQIVETIGASDAQKAIASTRSLRFRKEMLGFRLIETIDLVNTAGDSENRSA